MSPGCGRYISPASGQEGQPAGKRGCGGIEEGERQWWKRWCGGDPPKGYLTQIPDGQVNSRGGRVRGDRGETEVGGGSGMGSV